MTGRPALNVEGNHQPASMNSNMLSKKTETMSSQKMKLYTAIREQSNIRRRTK